MSFNRYSLDLESSSSQYAYVADNAALSITGDISIEAWIKLEQLPSTAGTYFGIATKFGTAGNFSYEFCLDNSNKLFFWYNSDGSGSTVTYGEVTTAWTSADVGKFVHIAVTVDVSAATIAFYKAGSALTTSYVSQNATSIYDGTANFCIGARAYSPVDFYFDGMFNNVRVWSDIRTAQEIQDNMYLTLTGTSNNLVGSWFSTANNYNDLAGTNNLTSSGSPVFSTNVPWTGANTTDWTQVAKKIDYTKVSGSANLTNFPVLIKDGNIPDAMYAGLQSAGQDFRITTDSTGAVEVPFEIVAIDTTAKTAEIWAKIPTVSYTANTNLYFWYGNANAVAYDANAPFGSQNVWSSQYKYIDHLQGDAIDETSNAVTTTDTSVTFNTTNGKFTQGGGFASASNSRIEVSSNIVQTGNFTVSMWVKAPASDFLAGNVDYSVDYGFFTLSTTATSKVEFNVFANPTSSFAKATSNNSLSNSTYKLLHATRDGTNIKLYLDGSFDVQTAWSTAQISTDRGTRFGIGKNGAGWVSPLEGTIDEIRVSNTASSADWIATEYANQNSPSTFIIAASNIKSVAGVAYASIKNINGLAMTSIKNVNGLA